MIELAAYKPGLMEEISGARHNAQAGHAYDEQVLVFAPKGGEAEVLCMTLSESGIKAMNCSEVEELCLSIEAGAGAAVVVGELLAQLLSSRLRQALSHQLAWSDFPLIVLAGGGVTLETSSQILRALEPTANVMLLERPVCAITLLSTVRAALRSRRRQYELRDLAGRRRVEENLLKEKNFSDAAINSLPGIFYVLDSEGLNVRRNKVFEEVTGYSAGEIDRMHGLDFVPEESKPIVAEKMKEVFTHGQATVDADLLTKQGVRIPYFFTGRKCLIEGRPYLIGMGIDMTEKKEAGRRLQELYALAERRVAELDAVIESMPDAVYIGNENGISKCNTNALKQLGAAGLEDFNARIGELGAKFALRWPDGRPLQTEELQFVRALRGETAIGEVVARKLDTGEDVYLRIASAPIWQNGRILGAVAIDSDITERIRVEKSLEEAKEQIDRHASQLEKSVAERTATLEASLQSISGVLYHVAHDLRAPLRTMQGFTTILEEEYAARLGETGGDYARRIAAAASRMDKLIQDLLAYGRLAHVSLSPAALDLNREIKSVLRKLAVDIRATHALVRVDRLLPKVWADPAMLDLILINLLKNALVFVSPGDSPRIEIQAQAIAPGTVRIAIQDHGLGIAPEHQELIFRVFERLHPQNVESGTGIGLAIVRKAAERMGGMAGVESKPGVGSLFWFELPAARKNLNV